MGVIVEKFADERGIVWPASVAPAQVYLARLGDDSAVTSVADELYRILTEAGIEVLYDDRDERPGTKFADADLLGIPTRVVISAKTVAAAQYEVKDRSADEAQLLDKATLLTKLGL